MYKMSRGVWLHTRGKKVCVCVCVCVCVRVCVYDGDLFLEAVIGDLGNV